VFADFRKLIYDGRGANMTPEAIQVPAQYPSLNQAPDWFDDNHDSLLILLSRDSDENGISTDPEVSSDAA